MQQWHSFSEFIAMDGRGLYVWGAYGVTLFCMLIEPMLAAHRRRQAWRDAAQQEEDN